jgi:hypothetical protein
MIWNGFDMYSQEIQSNLDIPFQPMMSPFIEDIQSETVDWVYRFDLVTTPKLIKQLKMGRFNELTARCYPNSSYDVLRVINDWMTWLFILDDLFDEEGLGRQPDEMVVYCTDILNVFATYVLPDERATDPMFISLLDLWIRTKSIVPPDWVEYFINNMGGYFEACIWESSNRLINQLPATPYYIIERRKTGGVAVFISWSLITETINLPVSFFDHPVFRQFFEIVGDVLCWTNDLVSVHKERANGDLHNIVMLVQRDYRVSLSEALNIVIQQINDRVQDYLHLEAEMPEFYADSEIQSYLGVLRSLMRGNLDWSFSTMRY